ncbi:unnamed protein product [Brassica oleracea]
MRSARQMSGSWFVLLASDGRITKGRNAIFSGCFSRS